MGAARTTAPADPDTGDHHQRWEYVYLVSTACFGADTVKVFYSGCSPSRFMATISKYYPDAVRLAGYGIHPVSERAVLESQHLRSHPTAPHGTEHHRYCIGAHAIAAINTYLATVCATAAVHAVRQRMIKRVSQLCTVLNCDADDTPTSDQMDTAAHTQPPGSLTIDGVVQRITAARGPLSQSCPLLIRHLLREQYGSLRSPHVRLAWKLSTMDVYDTFLQYYVARQLNAGATSIVLSDILISARKWFVCEHTMTQQPIPHKIARRCAIMNRLDHRFGPGIRAARRGVKTTTWCIRNESV